jgi:hypothetical protein
MHASSPQMAAMPAALVLRSQAVVVLVHATPADPDIAHAPSLSTPNLLEVLCNKIHMPRSTCNIQVQMQVQTHIGACHSFCFFAILATSWLCCTSQAKNLGCYLRISLIAQPKTGWQLGFQGSQQPNVLAVIKNSEGPISQRPGCEKKVQRP